MTVPSHSSDLCVARNLLDYNAIKHPQLVLLKFGSGESFTSVKLREHIIAHAAGLQRLGVQQGDYVLSWLPNGPMAVTIFLALNYIGAIYVPINTAYRGGLLQHVISNSKATLMISDGRLIDRLTTLDTRAHLRKIVVIGTERPELDDITLLPESALRHDDDVLQTLNRDIQPHDTQLVIFTSGTTGPSKGVLCSYTHTYTAALEFRHVGPGDCNLVTLPMFHIGGVLGINFALIHGGTAAMIDSFHTSTFWETVRKLEVTTVGLLGAMVQFLMKQPQQEGERDHPVCTAVIAPFNDDAIAFSERFDIDVYTEFNMTELSVPLFCGPNPTVRGTCGKPRNGLELRLVDSEDMPVPAGSIGELILKMDDPWTISHGYLNNPEATATTWRNGWFHTGDLFTCDDNDNYFFMDRAKDAIRRRGENISSFEVEVEILAHPCVHEVAVVATPGLGSEDDVLAVIAPMPNSIIKPAELLQFLQNRLAHFMIPRYVRLMEVLPKTPTQKVEKHLLRAEGVTQDTWDREAAGIIIKRDKLTSHS